MRYQLLAARRGLTLLEVMIASVVFLIAILATLGVLSSATDEYSTGVRIASVAEDARRSADRMAEELRTATASTVIVATSVQTGCGDLVEFDKVVGYSAGAPVTQKIQYRLEPSPLDADENGVGDDYMLVREEIATAAKATVCHFVAADGLSLSKTGDQLVIRLSLKVAPPKGSSVDRVVETAVSFRN